MKRYPPVDSDSVDNLKPSPRAAKVLVDSGIDKISQLRDAPAFTFQNMPSAGSVTLRELAQLLLLRNIRPVWLHGLTMKLTYPEAQVLDLTGISSLEADGWYAVADPYSRAEHWMLETALAELVRDGIPHKIIRRGDSAQLALYRRNAVPLPPEGEDPEDMKPSPGEVFAGPVGKRFVFEVIN